jgi:curved DNA-binding protein CbpA
MRPDHDPHRVLGLAAGARPAEVLAAYLRLRRALRSDSLALVSLDCEAARREELARVEEAYRALSLNVSARGPVPLPGRPAVRL